MSKISACTAWSESLCAPNTAGDVLVALRNMTSERMSRIWRLMLKVLVIAPGYITAWVRTIIDTSFSMSLC